MKNNDDPIQELNHFRRGIDNLTENEEITSNYSNDLHNCSSDLSGKGSIREEIAHAEFARRKKEEILGSREKYTFKTTNINRTSQKGLKAVLIFIFVFFWMVVNVMMEFASMFGEMFIDRIPDNDSNYDVGVYEEDNNYNISDTEIVEEYISYEEELNSTEQFFQEAKNNIVIETTITPEYNMILEVFNNNAKMLSNVKVQVIFYDFEDKPIKICDGFISALFANGRNIVKIMDMPDIYERFEFVISQSHISNTVDIDVSQFEISAIQNYDGDFNVEVTNNSENKVDVITVALIYYKNNKIVDVVEDSIYDIKSGRTEHEEIYNFNDTEDYDRIEFMINDARIEE